MTARDSTGVLPAFRSPDLRDLAREAIRQGGHARLSGGGHVLLTNPATGDRVSLSTTAATSRMGHTLGNSRRSLERAGLLPRRHPQRQEVRVDAAMPVIESGATHAPRPGAQRAGGKFARTTEVEVQAVQGHRVRLWGRADGMWVAETPEPSTARGLRSWYADSRDAALAKVRGGIDTPPRPRRGGRVAKADLEALVATADAEPVDPESESVAMHGLPPLVAERVPARFHVVQVDREEYPLAAALSSLEDTVRPALAALQAAGKGDAADLLLQEVLNRTPVEEELLSLFRRVTRGE